MLRFVYIFFLGGPVIAKARFRKPQHESPCQTNLQFRPKQVRDRLPEPMLNRQPKLFVLSTVIAHLRPPIFGQ
jgi:hypothetical protein